ncbi:MAG: dipeptide ABC transporter ATP-binding protein [Acidimicrobiia bacterium]
MTDNPAAGADTIPGDAVAVALTDAAVPPAPTGPAPVASVRDLHVDLHARDGVVHALRGVDLDIAPGEVVALVGESGSGKSILGATLLGLLPRTARPSCHGTVVVDGVDMLTGTHGEQRRVLRRSLGAVFQDPLQSLNPTMRLGRQLTEKGASPTVARRRLQEVGVPEAERRLRQFPHELSGGLRQRVMIAMAITAEGGDADDADVAPQLVIADEPTTALDVSVQAQIVLLFDRLRREHGCAVLLVTHDLGVAASIADRIAVLYAGRLCEVGPAAEVLASPRHPYTKALLDARLTLDGARADADPLPGSPPDPRHPPQGCGFADRCRYVQPGCLEAPPPLRDGVACLFPLALGDNTDRSAHPAAAEDTPVRISVGRTLADHEPGAANAADAATADGAAEPALVLERVSKAFDLRKGRIGSARLKLNAVVDVSLTVPAGGAVALVGESGCGKTTTLRMATGLLRPDSGSVTWAARAARPQLVFQDAGASLTPWMNVLDHVVERLRFVGVPKGERMERAMALLQRVGLDGRAALAKPRALSGGQRQRAVIARALASGPSLLVCDEPVSALDATLAARVLGLLEELREELGVALLVVTHDLAAARRLGDDVAVMYLGRIIEHGPADELFERPRHPYTQGLLAAVPTTEPGRLAPTLAGEPPSPVGEQRGCAFVSRCPLAVTERCELEVPVLRPAGPNHAACHLLR